MKTLAVAASILGGVLAISPATADDAWRNKSLQLIKKERKVRDAIWSAPGSLWVGVHDDGSNRDGYAEYVCLLTGDAGRPENERFIVSIMDYREILRDNIKRLGTAHCG